jgi:hypothetical protein
MKRLRHDPSVDVAYIDDVFVPAHAAAEPALVDSVRKLESHFAEFEAFMHDVERGAIAVRQGFKGNWSSYVSKPDGWIVASYAGRLGPVVDFQKHQHKHPYPMIYGFTFNYAGYITRAHMYLEKFDCDFDPEGRLTGCHQLQ